MSTTVNKEVRGGRPVNSKSVFTLEQDVFLPFLIWNGMILSLVGIVFGISLIAGGADMDRLNNGNYALSAPLAVLITFGVLLLLISLGWFWFNYKLRKSENKIALLKTLKSIYKIIEGEMFRIVCGLLVACLLGIGIWLSVITTSASGFFTFPPYALILVHGIFSFRGYVVFYDSFMANTNQEQYFPSAPDMAVESQPDL